MQTLMTNRRINRMIDRDRFRNQRGVTMVSVLLLTVALLTLGLLAVRSSVRESTQAGQLVARERALLVAQAAVDLATAQYMQMDDPGIDLALAGYNPQGINCTNPCGDCMPGVDGFVTGRRNELLAGSEIGCGGRPCMRQGAVAFLDDSADTPTDWCDVPFRDLVANGDPEARVSVWVRNNSADALGPEGTGAWIDDGDQAVVVTAQARIRNTVVTVEREVALSAGSLVDSAAPQTPDEGYGGGHNNDNSAASLCSDNYVAAQGN